MADPFAAPRGTQPAGGRPPTAALWLIGCTAGCGLVAVALVIIVVVALKGSRGYIIQAQPTADRFIRALQQRRLDEAYALTSSRLQSTASPATFRLTASAFLNALGAVQSYSAGSPSWFTGTGGTTVTIPYTVAGAKASSQVILRLSPEQSHMRVDSFNYTLYDNRPGSTVQSGRPSRTRP